MVYKITLKYVGNGKNAHLNKKYYLDAPSEEEALDKLRKGIKLTDKLYENGSHFTLEQESVTPFDFQFNKGKSRKDEKFHRRRNTRPRRQS